MDNDKIIDEKENLIFDFFRKSYKIFKNIDLNNIKPEHKFKDWFLTVSSAITRLQTLYKILLIWNIINSLIIIYLLRK